MHTGKQWFTSQVSIKYRRLKGEPVGERRGAERWYSRYRNQDEGVIARPNWGHNSREVSLCFLAPTALQSHDKIDVQ